MQLTTARLELDSLTASDARRLLDAHRLDGERWHPQFPGTDATALLERFADGVQPEDEVFGLFVVRTRTDGTAIGGIGFDGPPDADGEVWVELAMVPDQGGNGYATEALRALVKLAADHGARRVKATGAPANRPWRRALEKAGFVEESRDEDASTYVRLVAAPVPAQVR